MTVMKQNDLEIYFFTKTIIADFQIKQKLQKMFFSATATSVSTESLFSQAGLIKTDLRNRINPILLE